MILLLKGEGEDAKVGERCVLVINLKENLLFYIKIKYIYRDQKECWKTTR